MCIGQAPPAYTDTRPPAVLLHMPRAPPGKCQLVPFFQRVAQPVYLPAPRHLGSQSQPQTPPDTRESLCGQSLPLMLSQDSSALSLAELGAAGHMRNEHGTTGENHPREIQACGKLYLAHLAIVFLVVGRVIRNLQEIQGAPVRRNGRRSRTPHRKGQGSHSYGDGHGIKASRARRVLLSALPQSDRQRPGWDWCLSVPRLPGSAQGQGWP